MLSVSMNLRIGKDAELIVSEEAALKMIREAVNRECRRAFAYAKDHTEMTFRDRTGSLYRALTLYPIRYLRGGKVGGKGYKQSFGIAGTNELSGIDERGVPNRKKFEWLVGGTSDRDGSPAFRWPVRYSDKSHQIGNDRGGKWWRVRHVTGISSRGNFLENAMRKTRRVRDAAFRQLLDSIFIKKK